MDEAGNWTERAQWNERDLPGTTASGNLQGGLLLQQRRQLCSASQLRSSPRLADASGDSVRNLSPAHAANPRKHKGHYTKRALCS